MGREGDGWERHGDSDPDAESQVFGRQASRTRAQPAPQEGGQFGRALVNPNPLVPQSVFGLLPKLAQQRLVWVEGFCFSPAL